VALRPGQTAPMLFLGAFANFRQATISFAMTVRPSAWNNSSPTGRLVSHRTNFNEILNLNIFRKSVEITKASLKSEKNNGHFIWRTVYIFFTSRSIILIIRNILDEICKDNRYPHFIFNNFLSKIVLFMRQCGKFM
jgi:hypothetical protein